MTDRKTVKAALKEHQQTLMRLPDVVGLGVVEEDGKAGLAVYVSSRAGQSAIPARLSVDMDGQPDTVEVHVIEAGAITRQD